ncbi:MAG: hypothetical protein N3I35_05040 [Clostridia bacterium]|nr:hypothetical protein [Clostridia bacterium]
MLKKILKIAYGVIVFGLLLITFSAYIELEFPKTQYDFGILGNIIVRSILKDFGIGLVMSGLVNIVIDKGGFSEDYAKKVAEVMTKDEFINHLSQDRMEEMLHKLQTRVIFNGKIQDNNNYYYLVQKEMINLLRRYYYDECFVRVECYIEGNTIRKVMNKRMVIMNPQIGDKNTMHVSIPFHTDMREIEGRKDKELFKINFFRIDSDDYTNAARARLKHKRIKEKNTEGYNVRFYGVYDINCETRRIVEMETQTIVPLTDNIFSNRLSQPCRSYDIAFHLHSAEYKIDGVSFCFMESHKNKVVDYQCEQSIEIRFTDWMLPGNGVVFIINPKTDDDNGLFRQA